MPAAKKQRIGQSGGETGGARRQSATSGAEKPQTAGGFQAALGRRAPNSAQIAQKAVKLEVPLYVMAGTIGKGPGLSLDLIFSICSLHLPKAVVSIDNLAQQKGNSMGIMKYEQQYLNEMMLRITDNFPARSRVAKELIDWVREHGLGGQMISDGLENWSDLRDKLLAQAGRPKAGPDTLARNISALAAHMDLDSGEERIFALAVRRKTSHSLESLCEILFQDTRRAMPPEAAVAHLAGVPFRNVRKALEPAGRLAASGLLTKDRHACHRGFGGILILRCVRKALEPPSEGLQDVLEKIFAKIEPAQVDWDGFGHLGAHRDFALNLLAGAARRREAGVHILLHGKPGTGKTEFCKALAKQAGLTLHAVGEADEDGDEMSRTERLAELRFGQSLFAGHGGDAILFDEMEDVLPDPRFGWDRTEPASKVHMNRMLETNPIPVLWTANDIAACDPAFLRRITFTLELRTPPERIRVRIWRKHAKEHGIELPEGFCGEMANAMPNAPAIASGALRAAGIAGGGAAEVRLAAEALSRAVGGRPRAPQTGGSARFDPSLANADHDLADLADRLAERGPGGAGGLCLSGPPGTGKSAFARHLACRMEMEILEKRASDLLDCYVGETEKNIADAFAEARDTKAFLIFDEADSLLRSREMARRSWEATQVNEMLTWMECHPLPFACTTNHLDNLDSATMRRFGLRVKFLPLDAGQLAKCFSRFFSIEPPADLRRLDLLTPGDFAAVAKRIGMLGIDGPEDILAELRREQESKPGAARSPLGFQAA